MATIEVKLKKPRPYYGMKKKIGDKILIDDSQIPHLVKTGFIDEPVKKSDKSKQKSEVK